jgi:hypothetical protein
LDVVIFLLRDRGFATWWVLDVSQMAIWLKSDVSVLMGIEKRKEKREMRASYYFFFLMVG